MVFLAGVFGWCFWLFFKEYAKKVLVIPVFSWLYFSRLGENSVSLWKMDYCAKTTLYVKSDEINDIF